jgi:hypothetical protein
LLNATLKEGRLDTALLEASNNALADLPTIDAIRHNLAVCRKLVHPGVDRLRKPPGCTWNDVRAIGEGVRTTNIKNDWRFGALE